MPAKKKKPAKRLKVEEVGVTTSPEKPEEEKSPAKEDKEVKTKKVTPVKETKEETAADDKVSEKKTDDDKEEKTPEKVSPYTKLSSFKLADIEETVEKPATEEKTADAEEVETEPEETPSTETSEEKLPEVKPIEKPQDSKDKAEDWLEDVKPEDQEGSEEGEGGSKKKIFLIILLLVILAGVVAGGIYYYQTSLSEKTEVQKVEEQGQVVGPTEAPAEEEEEATQSAEIVAGDYSVNILNGSGIAGEAGKVKTLLEGAEFEEIDTGNAVSYDYVETEVSLKKDTPKGVYDLVKDALESDYIVSKSETELDEDSDYDVGVIVGSKKVET